MNAMGLAPKSWVPMTKRGAVSLGFAVKWRVFARAGSGNRMGGRYETSG
ncbi:hypothetical protein NB636_07450 [Oxalobacter aliiformigenes]|nr:hypothetical protein [Oxalobacter aliiformigenes]MCZ4063932.1 hypothetical protein [Oxalobacter aliiformigenes]WAV98551.1 hypothetical protein NB636_07450 [Oxalobacter aliiformigenes]